MHVGNSEVAALVAVGGLLVVEVEVELVEKRGLQVVDVDGVARDAAAEVVGFAVGQAAAEIRDPGPDGNPSRDRSIRDEKLMVLDEVLPARAIMFASSFSAMMHSA